MNDYELIVVGLAHLFDAYADRIEVRDRIVVGEPIEGGPVDVALYDSFGRSGIAGDALAALVSSTDVANVALFSADLKPDLVAHARELGVRAFISKALPAEAIVAAIEQTARGEEVFAEIDGEPADDLALVELDWPGRGDGLSQRESEVLVLIGEGLTNAQIATALYVGVETVKTHVKAGLARLGVRNRVQAALYVSRTPAFARFTSADPSPTPSPSR